MEVMQISPSMISYTLHMENQLKEFEELLPNNALLKVQNQAPADRNPKWKEWL